MIAKINNRVFIDLEQIGSVFTENINSEWWVTVSMKQSPVTHCFKFGKEQQAKNFVALHFKDIMEE